MTLSRRDLLRSSALAGLGLAVVGGVDTVFGSSPAFAGGPHDDRLPGFGPLVPDPAGLLDLPAGFTYAVVTRTGDPLQDASGATVGTVPGRQDGTASFAGPRGGTYLVSNHEQGQGSPTPVLAAADLTYDAGAQGGTSTLVLDRRNRLVRQYASLAGTFNNCAGGVTPWGTWLTCEETEQRADAAKGLSKDHGWVFEVSPDRPEVNRDPVPLTALGRFAHEAVAIDPRSGIVYLTEDASSPNGLLYRCLPKRRHGLHSLREGGTLEAMLVPGVPDLSPFAEIGTELAVEWKAVPDPLATTVSTRKQFDTATTTGTAGGAITRSRKFEGAWYGDGRIFVVCSYARLGDGSAAEHDGQVWSYEPRRRRLRLEVRFDVNPDTTSDAPDGPDNITVSPYGGLILAEDGEGVQHLLGVTERGETFLLARNALNDSEFTGPTFSPDRRTLFANIQDPGITLAIDGPWTRRGHWR